MNEASTIQPVTQTESVPFRCQLCGACCREVENSLMLEPMDIYQLGRLLRKRGEPIEGLEIGRASCRERV